MSRPANQRAAARQARALLASRLPGSRRGRVAQAIWRRWQVGPYQWQLKHLRWYLLARTAHLGSGTRYRHWLTVRLLIFALDKDDWIERLDGPCVRPTGVRGALKSGRPALEPTPPAR
ncbi:MAG: hypothetical protein OEM85_09675 [Gammaproteobacteria bacterium]|nr:hypothetical protein [Gammaproteobacteria bacterium]MDH3373631.1 hypothetical protein [Gammaproteobacteria bacterium]